MEGYALNELEDSVALAADMFKYRPLITWEISPALNVEESRKVIKEAAEAVQGISGALIIRGSFLYAHSLLEPDLQFPQKKSYGAESVSYTHLTLPTNREV